MASVQELLLAAQANQSPFQSLIEGFSTGMVKNQESPLDLLTKMTAIKKAQQEMEIQQQKMANQARMNREAQLAMGQQWEQGLKVAKNQLDRQPTNPFPSGRMRQKWTQNAEGEWSRTVEAMDLEDAEMARDTKEAALAEKQARTDYYRERAGDVKDQQEERNLRERERRQGRFRNYFLDLEQRDPVIKEVRKQELSLAAVDGLSTLVKEGNTVAFSALGTKMARGMGEVGVLTEQDIKRYVRSGQIGQKAADTLSTWLRGKPTEATQEEISDITKAMRSAFVEKVQPRYDQFIDTYSNIEKMKPEEFASELRIQYKPKTGGINEQGKDAAGETPDQRKARLLSELRGAK